MAPFFCATLYVLALENASHGNTHGLSCYPILLSCDPNWIFLYPMRTMGTPSGSVESCLLMRSHAEKTMPDLCHHSLQNVCRHFHQSFIIHDTDLQVYRPQGVTLNNVGPTGSRLLKPSFHPNAIACVACVA